MDIFSSPEPWEAYRMALKLVSVCAVLGSLFLS